MQAQPRSAPPFLRAGALGEEGILHLAAACRQERAQGNGPERCLVSRVSVEPC